MERVTIIIATVEGRFEGVETVMIPLRDGFIGTAGDVGHMDANRLGLANAIEATDALLHEAGIERQIKEHEVMRELEITSFTADFGTEQELGAGRLGKPRSLSVALHQREAFVKEPEVEIEALFDRGFEGENFALRLADEQDFLLRILFE